jgi:hypothetical protein
MYNVKDFGAAGVATPVRELTLTHHHFKWLVYPPETRAMVYDSPEGVPHDSVGIQKAIDAACEAGGGTVLVPAGDYLISPIELKSRVCLHLEPGARLWGSPHIKDYDAPPEKVLPAYSHERGFLRGNDGMNGRLRLISAAEAEEVSITGHGQISGQSPAFVIPWMNTRPVHSGGLLRPSDTFLFHQCRGIRLEGVRIVDTPCWSVVFDRCDGVRIHGIRIQGMDVMNNDAIDLVDTSNVVISDCEFHVTDDVICLKNMSPDRTMRNIVVTNCLIRTLCNAVKIGTDTAGNFEDIAISNLVIHNSENDVRGGKGINLSAVDGGVVRNVSINTIVMRNVGCAFYLVTGCRRVQQEAFRTPRAGRMEGVSLTNIRADGTKYASFVVGQPGEPIRDVLLSGIRIRKAADFAGSPPGEAVPERPEAYPSPVMFGSPETGDQLPAWGFYARHVEGLVVRDFSVHTLEDDGREAAVQENCHNVDITGWRAGGPSRNAEAP